VASLAPTLLKLTHMRSYILAAVTLFTSGCMLFFDDGGRRPEVCDLAEPASAPAPLRDPERLTCESFGGTCNPQCGPCPAVAGLAPIPSWGVCGDPCEALDEATCAARAECRVVRDARCAIDGNCTTDFLGCFPLDGAADPSVDCFAATDGWACSRSAACTALHVQEPCPLAVDAQCPRPFGLCVPEGRSPGRCHDQALCDAAPPACSANTLPGVANGCYTGACIPLALCEPI